MAAVNDELKFVHLSEPHTASRATTMALCDAFAGTRKVIPQHGTLEVLKIPSDYRVVVTVRNPFDILITQWKRPGETKTLEEFVKVNLGHRHLTKPTRYLAELATFVCWYEHLEPDLGRVYTHKFDLPRVAKHASINKEHWSTYYTEELKAFLLKQPVWATFVERFGYQFKDDGSYSIDEKIRRKLCRPLKGGRAVWE